MTDENKSSKPNVSYKTSRIQTVQADLLYVEKTINFFNKTVPVDQQTVDYNITSIVNLLRSYGLAPVSVWNQIQGPIIGTDGLSIPHAFQGFSVSMSDTHTIVSGGFGYDGGVGAIWIYTKNGDMWIQSEGPLYGSGAIGQSVQGYSVDISADDSTIVVGGPLDDGGVGAVWIFVKSGTTWVQQGPKLTGTAPGNASLGVSVSISDDGNTVVAGIPYTGGPSGNEGAIVFVRNGTTWSQQGSPLSSGVGGGISVAISGDGNTIAIGAPKINIGDIYIYTRLGTTWNLQAVLAGTSDSLTASLQGYSVSLSYDGNTVAFGGPDDTNVTGAVWVFVRNGNIWTQQGQKLVGTNGLTVYQAQGYGVSLTSDGNMLSFGGPASDSFNGAVWVFVRNNNIWSQDDIRILSDDSSYFSSQGWSTVISNDKHYLVFGGPNNDIDIGGIWVYGRN